MFFRRRPFNYDDIVAWSPTTGREVTQTGQVIGVSVLADLIPVNELHKLTLNDRSAFVCVLVCAAASAAL